MQLGFLRIERPPDIQSYFPSFLLGKKISLSAESGLGRCPKNPQGTSPLTQYRALPEPVLAGRQEKGATAPFPLDRIIREPYVNRLSRHILGFACGIPRILDRPPSQACQPSLSQALKLDPQLGG